MGMPRLPEDRAANTVTELEQPPSNVRRLNSGGDVAQPSDQTPVVNDIVGMHERTEQFDMEPLDKEACILHLIACHNLAEPEQQQVEMEVEDTYRERQDAGVGWHLRSVDPALGSLLELCGRAGDSMTDTRGALLDARTSFRRLLGINSAGTLLDDHDESTRDLPLGDKQKLADERRKE